MDGSSPQKWHLHLWRHPDCLQICSHLCPMLLQVSLCCCELLLLTATGHHIDVYLIFCPYSPSPDANEWSVFVGPHIVNGLEVFQSSVGVDRIIVSTVPGINIALLKLAELVTYEDYIQPVCMDVDNTRSFPAGTPCWVAGWEKESASTGKVSSMFWIHSWLLIQLLIAEFMWAHWIFVGSERAVSGLHDLETRVASCGNVSDSDLICTNTMNLHLVNFSP